MYYNYLNKLGSVNMIKTKNKINFAKKIFKMKNTIYIFLCLIIFSCGKDDDKVEDALSYVLNASGALSEQTAAQAKKTIYGKWDFGNSSKSSRLGKKNNQGNNFTFGKRYSINNSKSSRLGENPNCEFNFIEFNDDTYLMAIDSDGRTEYLGGVYVVNENSDNKVTSVELKFTLDSKEITIATLTDIVVVETNSKFDATFKIVMNFPEDADFAPCNSLTGNVSVDKEEPLEASSSGTSDTNHGKLIKTWNFVSIINSRFPDINRADEIKAEVCIENIEYLYDNVTQEETEIVTYRPNCIQPTNVSVSFSTYGTYTAYYEGGSDGIQIMEVNNWDWNENQTKILISQSDEVDEATLVISSITDDSLILTETSDGEVSDFVLSAQ